MKSPSLSIALLITALVAPLALAQVAPPARIPAGAKAHRDLAYVTEGHERQKLDLYLPEKAAGPLPLIIWVHGGGWQNGSKDGCPPLRSGYLERGYAVASLNYRLSQHAIFPAQIEDSKAAIRWLRAHAKEYGLDSARFGVWGSSAGGHLVALLGTSGDVKAFDVGSNLDQSSRVQAVCDYYGPTDFSAFVTAPGYETHATSTSPEAKLLGGAVSEKKEQATRANPITYVTQDDPPFLIVHGDKDRTVPIHQSQLLYEELKKSGVSVQFHTIHGAGHGGPGFNDPKVGEMVAGFFDRRLKNMTKAEVPEAKTTESTVPPDASAAGPAGGNRTRPKFDDILERSDTNKDGKVSRDEFRGPPAFFDRFDSSRDGFITREEYERGAPPSSANPAPTPSTPAPKPSAAPL